MSKHYYIATYVLGGICRYLILAVFIVINFKPAYPQNNDQLNSQIDQNDNYISYYKHYTVEDGLSSNDVRKVICDSNGFIWIATGEGLDRFDGQNFKHFNQVNSGLRSDQIGWIEEDGNQRLWISSEKDGKHPIDLLDLNTLEITALESVSQNVPVHGSAMFTYKNGYMYVSELREDGGKIFKYDQHLKATLFYKPDKDAENFTIDISPQGSVFLIQDYFPSPRTAWLNEQGQIIQMLPHTAGFLKLNSKAQEEVYSHPPSKNHIFTLADNQIIATTPFKENIFGKDNPILNAKYDSLHKRYLLLTKKSVVFLNEDGNPLVPPETTINEQNPGIFLHQPIFDRHGNALVPTVKHGFIFYFIKKKKYRTASPTSLEDPIQKKSLSFDEPLLNYQDQTWITRRELFSFDRKENRLINWIPPAPYRLLFSATNKQKELTLILEHSKKKRLSVISIDAVNPNWKKIEIADNSSEDIYITALLKDSRGTTWIGTRERGAFQISEKNPILKQYTGYSKFLDSGNLLIWQFFETKEGIWICAENDVFFHEFDKGITKVYGSHAKAQESIFPEIYWVFQDESENLWISSYGYGVGKLNLKNNDFKVYSKNEGLISNYAHQIFADAEGQIWVCTRMGLSFYDKQSDAFVSVEGIYQSAYFEDLGQSNDGQLFFSDGEQITFFHPQSLKKEDPSALVISELKTWDRHTGTFEDQTSNLYLNNEIRILPKSSTFTVDLALLDFHQPTKHKFRYFIDGISPNWVALEKSNIFLTDLPYGNFQLRIKAVDEYGNSAKNDLELPLIVVKPFYYQWWFLMLATLMIGLLIFSIVQWRTYQLRRSQKILEAAVLSQTKQLQAQTEELKQLDKLKSRFFANVSHELRTPLALMLGPISSMLSNAQLDSQSKHYLEMIKRNGKQLLKLVNEILDLGKLEASKMKLEVKEVLFYAFLKRLVAAFESNAQQKNIQFSFQYQLPEELLLQLDKSKMEIILNNLLSNAFKFTPHGGSVKMITGSKDGNIVITTSDTGRGIDPRDLPHIFDRYYQSAVEDAPTEGGTGIGLALTKELAQLFDGDIKVESTLGQGSVFTFYFPKVEVVRGLTTEEYREFSSQKTNGIASQKKINVLPTASNADAQNQNTILVVEDNPDLQTYIKTLLQASYQVLTANNGVVALELLNEHTENLPSLILSDVMMPEMDGYQLLTELKGKNQFRHIPVIMLTAKAALEDKLKALRIGVDDYILKPFEEEELLARVENILDNYRERISFHQDYLNLEPSTNNHTSGTNIKEQIEMISVSQEDLEWLKEVESHIQQHLANSEFTLLSLSELIFLSSRQIRRRLLRLTGLTFSKYVQEVRFREAKRRLDSQEVSSIKKLSLELGIKNVKYFSKKFKYHFGKSPSDYLENL